MIREELYRQLKYMETRTGGLLLLNENYEKFIVDGRILDKQGSEYLFVFQKDWQLATHSKRGLGDMVRICLRPRSVQRYLSIENLGFPFNLENFDNFVTTLHYKILNMQTFKMKDIEFKKIPKDFRRRIIKGFTLWAKDVHNIESTLLS